MPELRLTLSLLTGGYAVARLHPTDAWPAWAQSAPGLVAVVRSEDELTVICREGAVPEGVPCHKGWRALRVHGPFPFETMGVLAALAGALAEAGVSLLAVSTYDTDYILCPEERLPQAVAALSGRHRVLTGGT